MNIIFLTMSKMLSIDQHGIYTDLMRKFHQEGHSLFIVTPQERRDGGRTQVSSSGDVHVLSVKTLNVQKTNVVEKGLGQLSIEYLFKRAIKKYWSNVHFDLILYSTPPITFPKVISYLKKKNPSAKTYLMLKDIFPQNAVDLGMLSNSGLKGVLYNSFRRKEKVLYQLSDHIGCMSPANVNYLVSHNPEINSANVEVCPNSYEVSSAVTITDQQSKDIRAKYGIPQDRPVFIYGGNLGKPQGVPFLIECLDANKNRTDCHFVVVGDGTEFPIVEGWHNENKPSSVSVFKKLPKEDYDLLAASCDVGLIFLDYRFTIPNYPSRLLPYLMEKKPIIACTDPNCDTGSLAEANGYGYYCPSNSVEAFTQMVDKMLQSDMQKMGESGYQFFLNNYTVQHTYDAIMRHMN